MSTDSFGIGFVSAGFITAESHVPSLQYIRDAHVGAILNPTQSRAEALAETCRDQGLGDPTIYGEDEVAALTADPAVDGLWITSPNFTRVSVIDQAVDAVEDGANLSGVAIEKPVARTLTEVDQIRDRLNSVDLPTAYLENWPHEPTLDQLRSLLWERGRPAGRPYLARSQAEHGGPHSAWFWDGVKQGGGALTDMLCHALASNEILLTDPKNENIEAVAVTADTGTLKWNREAYAEQLQEAYGIDFAANPVDDYARATVRYAAADGTTAMSEATGSWCYVGSGVRRSVELLGPEYSGRVQTDDDAQSVFFSDNLSTGDGWAEKQTATSGRMPLAAADVVTGGYVAENRDAIEAFRNGTDGRFDIADGRRILKLCMAAYKAAEDGAEIILDEVDLNGYTPPPARD